MNRLIATLLFLGTLALPAAAAPGALTGPERDVWRKVLKLTVLTPACCGACPVIDLPQAKLILQHLEGDEATGEGRKMYEKHNDRLVTAFVREADTQGLTINKQDWVPQEGK